MSHEPVWRVHLYMPVDEYDDWLRLALLREREQEKERKRQARASKKR